MLGTLIGTAVSLGSTIFGAAKSSAAERAARQREAEASAKNMAYYKRQYNEDYADTAAGQNIMRQAREYADRNWKKAQGAAAVGGGTDAATAQAKEAGNKVVSDTAASLASRDVQRKDSAMHAITAEQTNQAQREANALRTQGANVATAAQNMGNAVGAAVGAAADAKAQHTQAIIAQKNATAEAVRKAAKADTARIRNKVFGNVFGYQPT